MYEVEKLNLVMQQYKLYAEQKENFISRSFAVNRFYLSMVIILLLLISLTKGVLFIYALSLPLVLSIVGLSVCSLWWMNMDSYNVLIKVKFGSVLEEIEKQLPVQPYGDEHKAIKELRENKKEFLFSDTQKAFSVIMFVLFLICLIDNIIPVVLG